MTKSEKQYLQKLEGEAWLKLAKAHYDFITLHGTFNTFDDYQEALSKNERYNRCLSKWNLLITILEHFNIECDGVLHSKALDISLKEPKLYN